MHCLRMLIDAEFSEKVICFRQNFYQLWQDGAREFFRYLLGEESSSFERRNEVVVQ